MFVVKRKFRGLPILETSSSSFVSLLVVSSSSYASATTASSSPAHFHSGGDAALSSTRFSTHTSSIASARPSVSRRLPTSWTLAAMFRSVVTRSSSASRTASQMRALACGAREGGGAWRTAAATDAKAANSETRCGLGSAVRYSASRETSGRRRRTSRRRAENRTQEAAAKERPSGKANSASGLRPEAGWRTRATRSWSRRMKAPRASRILSATRHLRATAASPWPEDAARSRSVSADASAAAERRDPRPKPRSASRWCADGGSVDGKRIRRRFPSQGIHGVVADDPL